MTYGSAADRIVEVAVPVPLDRTFHYRAVGDLAERLRPGMRVRVPFGRQRLEGYCVGFATESAFPQLKEIEAVLDAAPLLSAEQLELAHWIARTWVAGIGEVLDCMLPGAVRRQVAVRQRAVVDLAMPPESVRQKLDIVRSGKRRAVLEALLADDSQGLLGLLERAGCTAAVIKALEKEGWVAIRRVEVAPWELGPAVERTTPPTLTGEQERALAKVGAAVDAGRFAGFLLFGVTGSGKTEVYLRAIEKVIAAGGQAIVLVPEIALTPQTTGRFRQRFDRVAVMHSGMSDGERHAYWRAIAAGKASVVVGARSAVFAPAPRLRLIVIDEEHEPTFKQANSPRYHARDVALWRARHGNFPVVMGSATPSLESFGEIGRGRYELLELTHRIYGRRMPAVDVIDMRQEIYARPGFRVMGRKMEQLMRRSLERHEQVMLFLNRRGFSTFFLCPQCGHVLRCSQCDITLTFHRGRDRAMCHYCGVEVPVPKNCPECRYAPLKAMGMGTERVEQEMRDLFPQARLFRMDSDSMRARGSYEEVVGRLTRGEIDILVGTQMIAKGHDFPGVTLVGVIGADTALHLADFRARERTFQLLAQMAGRTGRGEKGGEVVIQSYTPEDYSIAFAAKHDYVGFARRELVDRRKDGYPPFGRIARVVLEGAKEAKVAERAKELAEALRAGTSGGPVTVLGPVACPVSRIKGQHRQHVVLKAPAEFDLVTVLGPARERLGGWAGVRVLVDVDPVNML